MDRKNKIIEILEKKSKSEKDQKEIETLIGGDKELKEFVSTYNHLSQVVSRSSHLSEEEISEYVLFKNGMAADDKTTGARIPFVETHLRKCSECSETFKILNSEYAEVDSFLSEKIISGERFDKESSSLSFQVFKGRYRTPRYALASIIVIVLVYLSLYIISTVSAPPYYSDAAVGNKPGFSVNRGRATEYFQNSLNALEKHDYDDAIVFLKKDIQQNGTDETIFYSYYLTGLSYLETAGHDFIGLFPGYNRQRAEKGIEYLKASVQKNSSGKFINIKLNSYFYLAKASLMLNDKESAREYLIKVIDEKGSKMEEAKQLLRKLE